MVGAPTLAGLGAVEPCSKVRAPVVRSPATEVLGLDQCLGECGWGGQSNWKERRKPPDSAGNINLLPGWFAAVALVENGRRKAVGEGDLEGPRESCDEQVDGLGVERGVALGQEAGGSQGIELKPFASHIAVPIGLVAHPPEGEMCVGDLVG